MENEAEGKNVLRRELLTIIEQICLVGSFESSEHGTVKQTLEIVAPNASSARCTRKKQPHCATPGEVEKRLSPSSHGDPQICQALAELGARGRLSTRVTGVCGVGRCRRGRDA